MSESRREAQIPRISGLIERSRLLEKLHLAVEHKLVLICAPPGYGKTTIAAQFAQDTKHTVVWHTVEEHERDFPTFYAQTLAAFSQIFPNIEPSTSAYQEPNELAAHLASFIRNNSRGELFYILDDVHNLAGSSSSEHWLQTFVSLIPPKCHVILISRTLPALPMTEMIARREVLAIGEQDLRFTPEEIDQLARQIRGLPLPQKEARDLVGRLEGWAAGIILALQPLPAELEQSLMNGSAGPEALFESLAASMLDAQPSGLRDFLLASSTLSRITPESAATILGLQNANDWINAALNRNLFIARATGGLTYHRLFRSFLQNQLRERYPEYYVHLHMKAARWYETNDRIDQAFDHYMTAGAPDRASTAIDSVLSLYYAQGKTESLLRWNETLSAVGVSNARLLYYAASIHIERLNYELANDELDRAEAIFSAQGDQVRVTEVQLQRALISVRQGHYLAAIAQAERLLEQPDEMNLKGRVKRILGLAYLSLGKMDLAARCLEEALPLSRDRGDKLALSNLLQDLQMVYVRLGRLNDASACLQEVVALRRSLGSTTLLALSLNDLGYHYHQHGDYAQAFSTLQEGLNTVARTRNKRIESYLLWSLADLQRDRGSFDEAWQLYTRALEFTGNLEPSLRCSILINASILRRWQNKLYEALSLAEEAFTIADAHGLVIETMMAQACCWAARAYEGEAIAALESLLLLEQELQKRHALTEAAHVMAICANAALLRYDRPSGEHYLRSALELVQQGGSWQPIIAEVTHSSHLAKLVIGDTGSRYRALAKAVKRLRESHMTPPAVIRLEDRLSNEYIYSLRVQTLGKEKIERDGVPVLPGEWRATAARELFFYLLFLGPKRREVISLDFWPDSSPSRVRSNYHTTLYRVRQALGENVIVFRDEQYMINPDLDIWCDARDFESLAERAQTLSLRDARAEDLFRRAVDLYQGDFLPLLDTDWIIGYRERLSEVYLDALIGLGRCAQERRDFKQAINIFRQALKVDPYREDVHRSVMTCFSEQGERQKIYAHLKELQKLLWTELRAEPAGETMRLAKSLLN